MASGHFFTILKLDELTVTNLGWPKVGVFVVILRRLEAVRPLEMFVPNPNLDQINSCQTLSFKLIPCTVETVP